jgi:hypothetical protein
MDGIIRDETIEEKDNGESVEFGGVNDVFERVKQGNERVKNELIWLYSQSLKPPPVLAPVRRSVFAASQLKAGLRLAWQGKSLAFSTTKSGDFAERDSHK